MPMPRVTRGGTQEQEYDMSFSIPEKRKLVGLVLRVGVKLTGTVSGTPAKRVVDYIDKVQLMGPNGVSEIDGSQLEYVAIAAADMSGEPGVQIATTSTYVSDDLVRTSATEAVGDFFIPILGAAGVYAIVVKLRNMSDIALADAWSAVSAGENSFELTVLDDAMLPNEVLVPAQIIAKKSQSKVDHNLGEFSRVYLFGSATFSSAIDTLTVGGSGFTAAQIARLQTIFNNECGGAVKNVAGSTLYVLRLAPAFPSNVVVTLGSAAALNVVGFRV